MNPGWLGDKIVYIGIVGLIILSLYFSNKKYFSIKNTNGPRERAFMIKASAVSWIAIILLLGLTGTLPNPYRYYPWLPYALLGWLGIAFINRTQQRIRKEESQNKMPEDTARKLADPQH